MRLDLAPFQLLKRWLILVSAIALLGSLLIAPWPAQAATTLASPQVAQGVAADSSQIPHNFIAEAVQKVGTAVVRIDTERTITRRVPDPFFGGDPFLRPFFGDGGFAPIPPREDRVLGQGSGFIIDPGGIILTNAHVVSGADTVTVTLKDGRAFEGKVRGADELTDLAVVKIQGASGELPMAGLGDSDQVQVGDWAIAVGNPVGLDNTVTLGIVSTLHRSSAQVGIPDKRLEFIQTDAAINPGNSGGPLLNEAGKVIGINTAIRAGTTGIGFAIPINTAKTLQARLIRGERIVHPYLGIQLTTLTPQLAQENNRDPNAPVILPEMSGALVVRVLPQTPAAAANLRLGDVIIEVDGQPVKTAGQLQSIVDSSGVGQVLKLKVRRGQQTQQLAIRTAELRNAA